MTLATVGGNKGNANNQCSLCNYDIQNKAVTGLAVTDLPDEGVIQCSKGAIGSLIFVTAASGFNLTTSTKTKPSLILCL